MKSTELRLLMLVLNLLPQLVKDEQEVAAKLQKAAGSEEKIKDVMAGVAKGLEQVVGVLI